MLLLFEIFSHFFQLKLLIQVQKQLLSLIYALLFSRRKGYTPVPEGQKSPAAKCWGHPLPGLSISRRLCTTRLCDPQLGEEKGNKKGNTTQLLLNSSFLFAELPASGRNIKNPYLNSDSRVVKITLLWLIRVRINSPSIFFWLSPMPNPSFQLSQHPQ